MSGVTLHRGDCLAVLPALDECSIDSIITDPPYGLSFMGSGTTGVACAKLGRPFIGIEQDAASYATAKARIDATDPLLATA